MFSLSLLQDRTLNGQWLQRLDDRQTHGRLVAPVLAEMTSVCLSLLAHSLWEGRRRNLHQPPEVENILWPAQRKGEELTPGVESSY